MGHYIINGKLVDEINVSELRKRNKPEELGLNFAIKEKPIFESPNQIHFISRSKDKKEKVVVIQNGKFKMMKLYTNRETKEIEKINISRYKNWSIFEIKKNNYIIETFYKETTDQAEIIKWLSNN
jgi:hypothetical protein